MLFCTTLRYYIGPSSSVFPAVHSLSIFSFIFPSSLKFWVGSWLLLAVFWVLLPSRLLVPVSLYNRKSPARPRLQPTRYGLSDPWIQLKSARFWCFYLLQIHSLNSILKVGIFWTFCDIIILLNFPEV